MYPSDRDAKSGALAAESAVGLIPRDPKGLFAAAWDVSAASVGKDPNRRCFGINRSLLERGKEAEGSESED